MREGAACGAALAHRRARTSGLLNRLLDRYSGSGGSRELDRVVNSLCFEWQDGLAIGPTEFSLALRQGKQPDVRVLSEVLTRTPLSATTAQRGFHWAQAACQRLSKHEPYDMALFRSLYETVYVLHQDHPPPHYRFGMGVQFGQSVPVLKAYFDLHAVHLKTRGEVLDGLKKRFAINIVAPSSQNPGAGFDPTSCRIFGVDFGPGRNVRVKLYWGARHLTWENIARWACDISPGHANVIDDLRSGVCNSSDALQSTLVSHSVHGSTRAMKVDICLARQYDNDASALAAVQRFVGPAIDMEQPLRIILEGGRPERTKCVQQYLSVEFLPAGGLRKVIYYRPLGMETQHLAPSLQPQECV